MALGIIVFDASLNNVYVRGPAGAPGSLAGGTGIYLFDANGVKWAVTVNIDGSLNTKVSTTEAEDFPYGTLSATLL